MNMLEQEFERPIGPDMSHFITEDDKPVDSVFCESQHRMLVEILQTSWPQGRPFIATSDVGLFYNSKDSYPVVPDFMLSLGVEQLPPTDEVETKSYFTWVYGKPPDLVVEVVSNKKGGEDTTKMEIYAQVRVSYYGIYDPFRRLSKRPFKLFRLEAGQYVEMANVGWMPEIGLGFTLWKGLYEEKPGTWLRFIDKEGEMLPTGYEAMEMARVRLEETQAKIDEAQVKIDEAQAKAEEAQARAERLAARLRELGLDE